MQTFMSVKSSRLQFIPRFLTCCLFAALTPAAFAAEGGFDADKEPAPLEQQYAGHKVEQDNAQAQTNSIRDLWEGAWVTLEGNIISKGSDDWYVFRDQTGTINVRISQEAWLGQHFNAVDLVRVSGRVSGKGENTTVSIERVRKP
ncbi:MULTISPECIES: YgiW/YdeI family stress tolerance OB fold protein [Enterobacterales]|uniref:YgiW/YdeI family stress tolerance OB fold protein n=1 Tax=Enterobacterales TaxID=91347 RepID=UPI000E00B3E4|nr:MULTISPECIES: NirD/YgiW/YdeI family stress tolerance protein [Serratia]MDW5500035.1 NirD/YgiW/YdeI family stress tolerance protein [Serratia proteamaculans]MDW5505099.1 NirD/YgiW/YdeI family stress tolerance protein [Pseudomonas lundensis]SUI80689.1 Uncharacterized conserved protein [Serratia liquefaciens]